ncbi:MAG: hypothetical protein ACYC6M_08125 [Terriglobales bacterium]
MIALPRAPGETGQAPFPIGGGEPQAVDVPARLPVVFGKFPSYAAFLQGLNFLRASGFRDDEVSVLCLADQYQHELRPLEWLSALGAFPVHGLGSVLVGGGLTSTFREVATALRGGDNATPENVTAALVRLGMHTGDVQELAVQLRQGALLLGLLPQHLTTASTLRQHLIAAGAQAVYSRQQNRSAAAP